MKLKKIFAIALSLVLMIGLTSQVAYAVAGQTPYTLTLPIVGSLDTDTVYKQTRETTGYNYASYVGWAGTEILCWIKSQASGTSLTTTSSYSAAGTVNMYYMSPAGSDYIGNPVKMTIKTSLSTVHTCNVRGTFNSN